MYRIKFVSQKLHPDLCTIMVSTLWACYHLMRDLMQESEKGDAVILYNELDEIIEFKINDGLPSESL